MVKLKNEYRKNGYDHTILWRDDEYAISKLCDDETGKQVCLEVFKIIIKKTPPPKSTSEYPREATPRDEEWGKYGYTVYTMEQAHEKIDMMRQRSIKNKNKKQK